MVDGGIGARSRRRALSIATLGTVAALAYAALSVWQILWLNPLAAVPGSDLSTIQKKLTDAGESLGAPTVVVMMAVGPLIAAALFILTATANAMTPWLTAMLYLALLSFGAIAYFFASFGAGMALADTYMIGGADYSPWARPLYLTSLISAVALVIVAVVGVVRQRRSA